MAAAHARRRRGAGGGLGQRGYDLGFGVGIAGRVRNRRRIGAEGRYDYAAIGNAVILAARLSGKAATGQILVSQRCYGVVEEAMTRSPSTGCS